MKTLRLFLFLIVVYFPNAYGQSNLETALNYSESASAKLAKLDYKGASADATNALKYSSHPELASIAYLIRGVCKNHLQDYSGAIEDVNKSIAIDSESFLSYFTRGKAKFGLEDYSGAIADFDRAIQRDVKSAQSYALRGIAKWFSGQTDVCCLDFKKAQQLGYPDAPDLIKTFCKD